MSTSTAQRKEWGYRYKACCTVLYDKAERADKRPVVCGARKRERKIKNKEEFRRELEKARAIADRRKKGAGDGD